MPFFYIDRRNAAKHKSAPNRAKLLKRTKAFVKQAAPTALGSSVTGGGYTTKQLSPIKVAQSALEEPWFAYSRSGDAPTVYIGNKEYERGDEIPIPDEDDGDGDGDGAGNGDNGEDDFIVNVAANEFLDLFFEDCELPNLEHEKLTQKLDTKQQPAGYSTQGNPAQLSVIRSYKQSIGRRRALSAPYRDELTELQDELTALYAKGPDWADEDHVRATWIEERIIVLQRQMGAISMFDKIDLRYKKREQKPLHTVEAVLFIAMDISGSMTEDKKRIARRWFSLLYAFISKRYPDAQVRFITHTTTADERSEAEFFTTKINGGTLVSPMLKLINNVIKTDYDPTQTNIYVSHASDGDNWNTDTPAVVAEMVDEGHLMHKLQHFSYAEVGRDSPLPSPYGMMSNQISNGNDSDLWEAYTKVHDMPSINRKMAMVTIVDNESVYPVFKKVFKKK